MIFDRNKVKNIGIIKRFSEMKYDLLFNFIIIVLGVVLGIRLENIRNQNILNDATLLKIKQMGVEYYYNLHNAQIMFNIYSSDDNNIVRLYKLDYSAAKNLFEDSNIYNVLKPYQVDLIRMYIDHVGIVNNINDKYTNYIMSNIHKKNNNDAGLRRALIEFLAGYLSVSTVMGEEFKKYSKLEQFDIGKMENFRKTLRERQEIIMRKGPQ